MLYEDQLYRTKLSRFRFRFITAAVPIRNKRGTVPTYTPPMYATVTTKQVSDTVGQQLTIYLIILSGQGMALAISHCSQCSRRRFRRGL